MKTLNPKTPSYVVQPGDNLSMIAQRQYGDSEVWPEIGKINGIANPQLLRQGVTLNLPAIQVPDVIVVNYVVPGMKLIPQTMAMSCWYASAKMLISWRRRAKRSTEAAILDPREDAISEAIKKSDSGLSNAQLVGVAQRLGLELIPPMSPSDGAIENWLKTYGPLWVNGTTHIVVIAGIRSGHGHRKTEVLVYDPSPVNVGLIQWRTLAGWYVGKAVDARDTSANVPAVFMHCPR